MCSKEGNATPFAGRTEKVAIDWFLSGSSVQGPCVSATKSSSSAICNATITMTRRKVGKGNESLYGVRRPHGKSDWKHRSPEIEFAVSHGGK
jgi:hypothetical protein